MKIHTILVVKLTQGHEKQTQQMGHAWKGNVRSSVLHNKSYLSKPGNLFIFLIRNKVKSILEKTISIFQKQKNWQSKGNKINNKS